MSKKLFEINPDLDRKALAEQFAVNGRLQIRDVLTRETAEEIRMILAQQTPWGMAMKAGSDNPTGADQIRAQDLKTPVGQQKVQQLAQASHEAAAKGDYAFRYAHYSLVEAYLEKWNPGGPHDLILEYLNAPDFIQLARDATGIEELIKADGQATLYAAQHFLSQHTDSHVAEGWRVAYVMNFAIDDWKPDWGGYLNFYDDEGDIVQGFRPRFNALNLFAVPQAHAVSYVPPFAPAGRFAITGWFRDQ
ncbi:2OG-Fe(II) oxygenase family protein [Pontixanthobacter sp. CEM42]|uniref:2OG-Fe(II) oxygenase n=1 Tax=Pontixanthobacter sp. CEM42 TaxID=2792077 RepID=UPI001AE0228F|nr:2OG-Fe(II) oxygenase family protein [Pontixanthobacter sp. CEM42]